MFTGIVKGRGEVTSVTKGAGGMSFRLRLPKELCKHIEIGASIAVDGVCLTVTKFEDDSVSFDVMLESLRRTTLDELTVGDQVNVERSALQGAEVGGHAMSGHVDCTAEVVKIERPSDNFVMTFKVEPQWMKYIFAKGYIGLGGCSLTIAETNREENTFSVWFIPETLRVTTFSSKKLGSKINLEVERSTQVMVDTVRDFLQENLQELLPFTEYEKIE